MKRMKGILKCFGIGKKIKEQAVVVVGDEEEEKEEKEKEMVVREFGWEEVERWTENFSELMVGGSGGYSTVYRAPDMGAAVKVIYRRRVFEEELEIMRRLGGGRRLVKLFGYSRHHADDQLAALVLEYVENGTLEERLADATSVIPWGKRMAIAYQLAEALDHLHHTSGPLPVVHGDIKPSNVLLDRHLNCYLCDFGSAKAGFTSSQSQSQSQRPSLLMSGSPGYTDPHYLRTGIPSKKNDIYSFGVLLLHLITGDHSASVDPRLSTRFDPHEASAMLALATRCLNHPPTLRPSASQILHHIFSSCNTTPLSALISSSK